MEPIDQNKIEEAKKDLYSRTYADPTPPRSSFEKPEIEVDSAWKPGLDAKGEVQTPKVANVFKKIFIFAIIFFLLSSSLALYVFFRGFNIISAEKVNVTFVGPVAVAAGEPFSFDIVVENNNDAPLLKPILYIDYPEGTKEADDLTKDLLHGKEQLADLKPNENVHVTARAVLFGEQQSKKQIHVKLEYGVKNSAAIFPKERDYDIAISSAPLTLVTAHPTEIVSNNEVEFKIDITSNSTKILKNLLLKVDYPFGFELGSSTPAVTYNNNVWKIPVLNAGERKTFILRGRVEGEEGDERIFRITTGAQSANNEKLIATAYLSTSESIHVKKPPITVHLSLNDSTLNNQQVFLGDGVNGSISFINNLPDTIIDTEAQLSFGGSLVNLASPRAQQGFYRSSDNKIIWSKTTFGNLRTLNPGEDRQLSFNFNLLNVSQAPGIKNGTVNVYLTVSGKRVTQDQGDQFISTQLMRTLKVGTVITMNAQLSRASTPFINSGPSTPKVNIPMTYTVIWNLANTSNVVTGAEVRATLPTQYVTWKNLVSPSKERIVWNPEKSEVTWVVGDLAVDTSGKPVRQVAFQVEVLPSISQLNLSPTVVNSQTFTGTDSFTQQPVSFIMPTLVTDGRVTQ